MPYRGHFSGSVLIFTKLENIDVLDEHGGK